MQAYDLIMLIVISMSTIFGAIKGFAWQVASLASIIVSYFVAYRFRFEVAELIQAKPPWNQFLAMLILYVGTSFVIWVGFRLLSGVIDKVRLKEFDRHLGAAFGLAKGMIYCLLITMFAMSLLGPKQQSAICQSRSGYYIAAALDRGVGVLPKEIHDVVGPYLAQLDSQLKHGQDGEAESGEASNSLWPGNLPGLPPVSENLRGSLPSLQTPNMQLPSLALPSGSGSTPAQAVSGPSAASNAPSWSWPQAAPAGGNLLPPATNTGVPGAGFPAGGQADPASADPNRSGLTPIQNFPPLSTGTQPTILPPAGNGQLPQWNGLRPAAGSQ